MLFGDAFIFITFFSSSEYTQGISYVQGKARIFVLIYVIHIVIIWIDHRVQFIKSE